MVVQTYLFTVLKTEDDPSSHELKSPWNVFMGKQIQANKVLMVTANVCVSYFNPFPPECAKGIKTATFFKKLTYIKNILFINNFNTTKQYFNTKQFKY